MNKYKTLKELLTLPGVSEHIRDDDIKKISESVASQETDILYIRIIIGIGAWMSSLFFIGSMSALLDGNELALLTAGVIFLIVGILLSRRSKPLFIQQACLALVSAGNILVACYLPDMLRHDGILVSLITQIVVCSIVYPFFNSMIYRFIAPSAVIVTAIFWLFEERIFYLIGFLIAAEMILAGVLLLKKKRNTNLIPLAYSLAVMLPGTILIMNLISIESYWADKIINFDALVNAFLIAGILYLFYHIAGNRKRMLNSHVILAVITIILLGVFTTPGILVGIGLLVLGYNRGDKFLMGLAFLFFPYFLIMFYYNMDVDLAYKAAIVGGSGMLLLVVRYLAGLIESKEMKA